MTKGREAIPSNVVEAEAKALKTLWDAARAEKRVPPQTEVGAAFEIGTQGAVWQYLNGHRPLNLKAARGFAAALKCQIADFSTRLAKEVDANAQFATPADDEFVPIPLMDGHVRGGSGGAHLQDEVIGELKFRADFLRECGVTRENGRTIKVKGHSMHPRIPDGAVVLVRLNGGDPVAGKFYALDHPTHGPIIKRLRLEGGLWYADSENAGYDPIPIREEGARIIGRAVWVGAKL